jgi:hypothetical protein
MSMARREEGKAGRYIRTTVEYIFGYAGVTLRHSCHRIYNTGAYVEYMKKRRQDYRKGCNLVVKRYLFDLDIVATSGNDKRTQ